MKRFFISLLLFSFSIFAEGTYSEANKVVSQASEKDSLEGTQVSLDSADKEKQLPVQRTLSIIKPDAVARNLIGTIDSKLEQAGLRIVAMRRMQLTKEQAQRFYAVHSGKDFYESLCDYMSSGPIVVQVLSGENAILKNREVMGATNPANAEVGTIRGDLGESIERNAVHGSDSPENAEIEINFFFNKLDIVD